MFYRYFFVVLLFGWLNLVNPSSQLNKKTFGEVDACEQKELDKYLAGVAAYVETVVVIYRVTIPFIPNCMSDIKQLLYESVSAISGIGPLLALPAKKIKQPDNIMKCLSQMSEKIENEFKKLSDAIDNSTNECINIIDELGRRINNLNIRLEFQRYKDFSSRIDKFAEKIKIVINPTKTTPELFNELKKDCNDTTKGPVDITTEFEILLKDMCSRKKRSVNVKKLQQTPTNNSKTFGNVKYANLPGTECLLELIKDAIKRDMLEGGEFFRRFVLDGIHILKIATYCGGIIFNENPSDKNGIEKFFYPINKTIVEVIEYVESILMSREIDWLKEIEANVRNKLTEMHKSFVPGSNNPTFWIGRIDPELLVSLCEIDGPAPSFLFIDGNASYRIINCPKRACFFIKDLFGMHVMYSRACGEPCNVWRPPYCYNYVKNFNLLSKFYFNLGEGYNKVNISNPNLTAVVDEFVQLNPFQYIYELHIAAIFYNNDGTNVKMGFQRLYNQPYVHRDIHTSGGIIKFFGPSSRFHYFEDPIRNCSKDLIFV
jgi:hypothetical protein